MRAIEQAWESAAKEAVSWPQDAAKRRCCEDSVAWLRTPVAW